MGLFEDAARDFAEEFNDNPSRPERHLIATVQTVTANAASDTPGSTLSTKPLVTVVLADGSVTQAAYDAAYTPSNGHTVLVLSLQGYPIILGRLTGFPPV